MGYYVKLNLRAISPLRVASEASGIIFCVPLAHDLSQYLENEWGLLSFFGLSQSLSYSQQEDPGGEVRITFVDILLVEIFK